MGDGGFSNAGIARWRRVLSGHVERGEVAGLVAAVDRGGETHVEAFGRMDFGDAAPMPRDAVFRIASVTKPIVAAAAMALVEDCRIRLDDPVDPWLPELANRRVLRSIESELDDTVPAPRSITLRDVLTYRMGFGSVMAPPDAYPIQTAIREGRIGGDGFVLPKDLFGAGEWLRRLGALPLIAPPGERWMYHVSGDVLGALVARASGRTLGEFMRERIFEPLGMRDTGFHVPPEKRDRLPALYAFDPATGERRTVDDPAQSLYGDPPAFESGGGGLLSTADDLLAFFRMMRGGGRLGRARVLSPATVSLMIADHLTPENREGAELFFGGYSSWGLGMAVDVARKEIYHSPGRFGWTGGTGTIAYADPANDLVGVLLTQRMMTSPEPPRVMDDFWNGVYGALD